MNGDNVDIAAQQKKLAEIRNKNIEDIRKWLKFGSVNIFGLPFSGKDTVGIRLAEVIGGRFLSSGLIIRVAMETDKKLREDVEAGLLAPVEQFYDLVLPYFSREDLVATSLVLSSVGRWNGEEHIVMMRAEEAGHPIKAAVLLNISEADVQARWEQAQVLQDRGERADDRDGEVLRRRIAEFREKTMPVVQTYNNLGLLVQVAADKGKDAVFDEVLQRLGDFGRAQGNG